MSKGGKLLLAGATVWPILYMFIFVGTAFFTVIFGESEPAGLWAIIIPLHLLTMLLIFGLITFYIVNVFRNERIKPDMKAVWAIVLFMGSMFAMPVYWYRFIWRDHIDAVPETPGPAFLSNSSTIPSPQVRETTYVPPAQPPDWR